MKEINKVGVVGSGTMGAGIAQLLIQNGLSAVIYDIDLETVGRARSAIDSRLERLVEKKRASADEIEIMKVNLQTTTDLTELYDCQLVIEAAPENIEIKRSSSSLGILVLPCFDSPNFVPLIFPICSQLWIVFGASPRISATSVGENHSCSLARRLKV